MSNNCDNMMEKRYSIKVENNTNQFIYTTVGCSKFNMNSYPDTTLPSIKPSLIKVSPNDYNYLDHSFKWEEVIANLPSDTLSIYIFDATTIDEMGWHQVEEGYEVLKRYDLSVYDLTQMNWTITYP